MVPLLVAVINRNHAVKCGQKFCCYSGLALGNFPWLASVAKRYILATNEYVEPQTCL